MKAYKRGLKRTYDHGQHILDKHDQDIRHAAISNTPWTSMTMTPRTRITPRSVAYSHVYLHIIDLLAA